MKKYSLRTELVLWSVGILIFYMATQMIFTYYFSQNYALHQKEQQISQLMNVLQEGYTDDPMSIFQLTEKAQSIENLSIMIYGEEELIYHSSSVGKAPDRSNFAILEQSLESLKAEGNFTHMDERENLWEGEFPNSFSQFFQAETEYLFLSELESNVVGMENSFFYKGQPRTIAIWSSTIAIDDTVHLFIGVNLWVSLAVICLTVCGVFLFSQRIIAPVTEMEKVASNAAKLDFSTHAVEEVRTKELNSLAVSINVMSENLEEMILQLNHDNRTLSDKVENQEKLQQMRRQFVANISHEMKTPLSMLMMYSENLKLDLPNIDKNFYYDTIIQEAAGLNAMVEQLLDTSAVENGLSKMDLQELDFSQFVTDCLEKTSPLLEKYTLNVKIDPTILVKGDRKYLEQAVRNYLTNAIAHCPEGGAISVSLEINQEEMALFQVTNEGKNIPDEDLPYLWDSFYRGDKSRTQTGEKRVGLGLYIVKTCISSHGGQVKVENLPDSVVFSFQIPTFTENS